MTHLYDGIRIDVEIDAQGIPICFTLNGRVFQVMNITDYWRIDEAWWDVRTVRAYYKVIVNGAALLLYRQGADWFMQRMYD
jgi:hypothetical protein